jgi:hypothetical protein
MFEIYKKTVQVNGVGYEIKPLSGKFLPKMFALMKTFQGSDDVVSKLDEATVATMHELCLETFKQSYPDKGIDDLDRFVSQNLVAIFPLVVDVNVGGNVQPS